MYKTKNQLLLAALLAVSVVSCDKARTPPMPKSAALPESVSFSKAALYPEGVEYDAQGHRFLVTSLREGIIGAVSDTGVYAPFIQNANFVSAIGIRIDAARDRLLVCNSDPGASVNTKPQTQGKLAGLGIFRLSTGTLIKYLDLGALVPGGHFCNDIALDSAGNAYVTDSFSPIIYRVDVNNNASVFLNDKRFVGEGFNLNGIVVKDNYLLVAKYNEGLLFKVPLDKPAAYTQVNINQSFVGADGLLWSSDGSLVVIANASTNKVSKLTSKDNWASAEVVASVDTGDVFATTGVVRDGQVYVLNARLNVLFNPKTTTHIDTFVIQKQTL